MKEKTTWGSTSTKPFYGPKDAGIRENIYKALGEESGIDVHVHNQIVRLTGVVDTEETIDYIISSVRKVPGVEEVVSELTVKVVQ